MKKTPVKAVCVFKGGIKGYVLFKEDLNKETIIKVMDIPKGKRYTYS